MKKKIELTEKPARLLLLLVLFVSISFDPLHAQTEPNYALKIDTAVSFSSGNNLLASDNGAEVVQRTDLDESAVRLNDGFAAGGWQSTTVLSAGESIDLVFRLPATTELSTVLVQPQNDIPGSSPPNEMELLVSMSSNSADFRSVGRFRLRRESAWQLFSFVPHTANNVILRIHSVYGSGTPGIGEIAAFAPGVIFREPEYYFSADAIGRVQESPDVNLPPEIERPSSQTEETVEPAPVSQSAEPTFDARIRHAQELLAQLGFKPGPADGMWGRRTGIAVMRFQDWYSEASLNISGELDAPTYVAMQAAARSDRRYTPPPEERPKPVTAAALKDSITGIPKVLDTGTLSIRSFIINLVGVHGAQEPFTTNFSGYIRAREVNCTRQQGDEFKCLLGDVDLSELVLLNGAARVKGDAPEYLKAAEQKARDRATGIWQ